MKIFHVIRIEDMRIQTDDNTLSTDIESLLRACSDSEKYQDSLQTAGSKLLSLETAVEIMSVKKVYDS